MSRDTIMTATASFKRWSHRDGSVLDVLYRRKIASYCVQAKSNRDVEARVEEVAGKPGVVRRWPPRKHPRDPAANHAGTANRAVLPRVDDLVSFASTPTPPCKPAGSRLGIQVPGFENRSTLKNHITNIFEYITRLTSPANQGSEWPAPGPSIQEAPSP